MSAISIPLCRLHKPSCGLRYPVPFEGPTPARIAFLGERPLKDDDRWQRMLVGRAGDEFTHTYLPLAGIPRSEVYLFNAVRCSNAAYELPETGEAYACASIHLGMTLNAVRPQILVLMGQAPCALFKVNLHLNHGIPVPGKWGAWEGVLFPTYHPNIGIRQTAYMIPLMDDFVKLGRLAKELEPML